MFHLISLWLSAVLLCVMSSRASAHLGHGSDIEVRVFDDKIRVVIRTAVINAWTFMGEGAPETVDEIGQAAAIPRLRKLAPDLMVLRRGAVNLMPREVDVVFEVDEHVAFVYVFPMPDASPVEVEVGFLKLLGDMETARLKAFDQAETSTDKDTEAFLIKNLHRGNFRAIMDLPRAGMTRFSPPIPPMPKVHAAHQRKSRMAWGLGMGAAAAIVAFLGWFGVRRGWKS
jgi:hypothetical protein